MAKVGRHNNPESTIQKPQTMKFVATDLAETIIMLRKMIPAAHIETMDTMTMAFAHMVLVQRNITDELFAALWPMVSSISDTATCASFKHDWTLGQMPNVYRQIGMNQMIQVIRDAIFRLPISDQTTALIDRLRCTVFAIICQTCGAYVTTVLFIDAIDALDELANGTKLRPVHDACKRVLVTHGLKAIHHNGNSTMSDHINACDAADSLIEQFGLDDDSWDSD